MEAIVKYITTNAPVIIFSAVRIILILICYGIVKVILNRVIKSTIKSIIESETGIGARTARLKSIESILQSVCTFVLAFILVIMLLQMFGINAMSLLTAAGVVGLAVGFGAQKMVKDVMSGFFILIEDQYGVGDIVTISGISGVVEEIRMRITKIRDANGVIHVFSNGDIIATSNKSKGIYEITKDIAISTDSDLQKARDIMNKICAEITVELSDNVKSAFVVVGCVGISATSVTFRIEGGINPKFEGVFVSTLNEKLFNAFSENDIKMA